MESQGSQVRFSAKKRCMESTSGDIMKNGGMALMD